MGLYCTKCGAKSSPTAKFCAGCGFKLLFTSFQESNSGLHGSSSKAEDASSRFANAKANRKVRTLFVIGSNSTKDNEEWLKQRFPLSTIMRFSTVGAIREASRRLFTSGQIESLCLMGSAKTVPTGRVHDHGETIEQGRYWSVESDLCYVETDIVVQEIPDPDWKGAESFLRKLGLKEIEGGLMPVGRIPADDLAFWESYFDSLDRLDVFPNICVAISNFPPAWINETRNTLSARNNSGCNSQAVFTLGALHEDEIDHGISNEYPDFFGEGSRIIVNLHGGFPDDIHKVQEFIAADQMDNRGSYFFELTIFDSFPKSILFLFSCYGGHSGWWRSGGAIHHFLGHGGAAAIASSTSVYCSPGEVEPGATLMCVEFFKCLDQGLTFGESLKLAKLKTFQEALNVIEEDPSLFCRTMKEIFQFSLFGAPWGVANHNFPTQNVRNLKTNSILDKVRTNNLNASLSSVRGGLTELNEIRGQIAKKLGNGIDYFSETSKYVTENLRKSGNLEDLTNQINAMGSDINNANFESLVWAGKRFNLITLRNEKKLNQDSALLVLDDDGKLLAKMDVKG